MTDTITVVGNIATNPEQRAAGPVPVTSFRIATSERRPDGHGAWVDAHTNYYTVSAFRTLGDHAFTSLRRGDRVIVSGRLRLKEWTAADGSRGRSVDIDADAIGHDLRFGTSVFQRASRTGDAGAGESTPLDGRAVDDAPDRDGWTSPQDAWSAPGVDAPTPTDGGSRDDAATDGETLDDAGELRPLVLAGATPF